MSIRNRVEEWMKEERDTGTQHRCFKMLLNTEQTTLKRKKKSLAVFCMILSFM